MRKQAGVVSLLAPTVAVLLAACGGSTVTVRVEGDGPEGPVPEANLEVFFYPFDRDSVFDILDSEAATPRPTLPEEVRSDYRQSLDLQEEWRQKDAEWSDKRDQLRTLSDQLQGMDRRSRDYVQKYEQFQTLDRQVSQLEREKKQLFDRFTELQEATATKIDSFRIVRDAWEDETYAGYGDLESQALQQAGKQVYTDTTNTEGYISQRLPGGDWWVTTRVPTQTGELYWNLEINPSQIDTLILNADNGKARERF